MHRALVRQGPKGVRLFPGASSKRNGRLCRSNSGLEKALVAAGVLDVRPRIGFADCKPFSAHFAALMETAMTLGTILIIVLILILIGALPTWGYSRSWGYGPGGIVGLILIIIIILALMGRI